MIKEKREYKNPPNVRAVLAQVRREQRLRKKQKASVTPREGNHANQQNHAKEAIAVEKQQCTV